MNEFIFPCGVVIFVFFMAFWYCSWHFKRRYIMPLERRVRRLENLLSERHTAPIKQTPPKPLPPRQRYIPMEERRTTIDYR